LQIRQSSSLQACADPLGITLSLAHSIKDLASRAEEDVTEANQIAQSVGFKVEKVTLPQSEQWPAAVYHTPKSMSRPITYFANLKALAQTLKQTARNILSNPTEENLGATTQTLDSAIKALGLEDDRPLFELSLLGPIKEFVSQIDFSDNRDKVSLRPSTIAKLAEFLPESSAELMANIETGPFSSNAQELAKMLKA